MENQGEPKQEEPPSRQLRAVIIRSGSFNHNRTRLAGGDSRTNSISKKANTLIPREQCKGIGNHEKRQIHESLGCLGLIKSGEGINHPSFFLMHYLNEEISLVWGLVLWHMKFHASLVFVCGTAGFVDCVPIGGRMAGLDECFSLTGTVVALYGLF